MAEGGDEGERKGIRLYEKRARSKLFPFGVKRCAFCAEGEMKLHDFS